MKSRTSRLTSDLGAVPRGGDGALTAAHLRLQEVPALVWDAGLLMGKGRGKIESPASPEETRGDSQQMFLRRPRAG